MHVAILSDIHANLHALEAVWHDLETQKPDVVYCLGDLVGYGAFPNEVVDFLREREVSTIMGNYDEGVGFDLDDCGCVYRASEERARGDLSLRWSQKATIPANKAFLRSLLPQLRLEDRNPSLLLVHGSPRKINEYVYQDRPQATFERLAALAGTDIVLFGHTHLPYTKQVGSTLFINTGSVGKPRDGDSRAGYILLRTERVPQVDIRRVTYDVEAAARAIEQAGLPKHFGELLKSGGLEPAAEGAQS